MQESNLFRLKNASVPTWRTLYFEIDATIVNSTARSEDDITNLTAIFLSDIINETNAFDAYMNTIHRSIISTLTDAEDLQINSPE